MNLKYINILSQTRRTLTNIIVDSLPITCPIYKNLIYQEYIRMIFLTIHLGYFLNITSHFNFSQMILNLKIIQIAPLPSLSSPPLSLQPTVLPSPSFASLLRSLLLLLSRSSSPFPILFISPSFLFSIVYPILLLGSFFSLLPSPYILAMDNMQ